MTETKRHIDHLISPYLDGELDEARRKEFESHLEQCQRCRELLGEHQKTARIIQNHVNAQTQHLSTEMVLAYRQGDVSPWQRRVMESHLDACAECRKLLEAAEALDEAPMERARTKASQPSQRSNLRALLDGFLNKRRLIPAIATVAVIILALVLFLPKSNPYQGLVEITPAQYVAAEIRGEEDEAQTIFQTGMERYLAEDYTAAEHFLQEAIRIEPDNPQFQFFYAVTLLLNQDYEKALNYLASPALRQSAYREDALWYSAQAQLKLGKAEGAMENLRELAVPDSRFSDTAKELLKKIGAIKD